MDSRPTRTRGPQAPRRDAAAKATNNQEITSSLEGAVRLLAHSIAGGDVIDPETCQLGAMRLIDRALRFVGVAA